jgi:phosphoribosylglycinamide formyltransferase 1
MALVPIHNPVNGPMKTVALMSGSGTNVRKIIEHGLYLAKQEGEPLYEISVIFSDSWDSQANTIGNDYNIPVISQDLVSWMKKNNVKRHELDKREEFDRQTIEMLKPFGAKIAIYGGYMALASPALINAFTGINVHPADLSVALEDGKRKWTGAHAVRDAIFAGEKTIRSSTHLVILEVDSGQLLMLSPPLTVEIPQGSDLSDPEVLEKVSDMNQEKLKEGGDWVIFPRTIEDIARGCYLTDPNGDIFYKGQPVPMGVSL